jgi:3-deoxy-manno-octulosonate cytidylyltransferase (CMP-KDO synthetase)
MNSVIGVIPARYASTRFPGKPLALLNGKPMIEWVVKNAAKSKTLSQVVVATDDDRIVKAVEAAGFRAVMTDSDLPSGSDRIEAALLTLEKEASLGAGAIIVNIQGDEPLIQARMIDDLVAPLVADSGIEMSTLAHEISDEDLHNMNAVKVVCNDLGDALYFSRFPIPYSREKSPAGACLKHVGLYAYQRHFLKKFCATPPHALERAESLEQLRALAMGARIRVVKTEDRSWGVDTPGDLAKIEELLGAKP